MSDFLRRRGIFGAIAILAIHAAASGDGPEFENRFTDLVTEADAVFVGTASGQHSWLYEEGRMVFTDVSFTDVELIHVGPNAILTEPDRIVLTHAGGSTENHFVSVSGTPRFEMGTRYLVLSHLDGVRRANPVVGGRFGLFPLEWDEAGRQWYPLTLGRHGVQGVDPDLQVTHPIDRLIDGEPVYLPEPSFRVDTLVSHDDGDGSRSRGAPQPTSILSLDGMVREIGRILGLAPPPERPMPPAVAGSTLPVMHLPVDPTASPASRPSKILEPSRPTRAPLGSGPPPVAEEVTGLPGRQSPRMPGQAQRRGDGDPVCVCGWQELPIVMEQVPSGWWSWPLNNDSMWIFNQYVDIFRYTESDGTWGLNLENEFGGWPSNEDLAQTWGFAWNGGLAMACVRFDGPGCSEILEADVVFNPEFGWTDDFAFANANHYSVIDYGRAVMHELGHVWGMQVRLCGETYAYDRLTVMHGYSPPRIEDSFGIHNGDAWGLRLNYQDQASPFPITDVGVESYFASWGLLNAWVMENEFDAFAPGDPISINGITVENNSGFPVDGVRIRLFLSTNTIISEFDHQMGGYWYFNQPMPGQSEWAGDLTTTVPNVAPGNYHVGIIVTTDGDAWAEDDFPWNNATYLFDRIVVVAPPGNDECGLATTLGSNGLYQVSTHGATTSGPYLPASCGGGTIHDDVWYRFDSSFDGLATVSFCADGYASIDMRMSVHEGNCVGPVVACNDDACSADPEMEFPIACGRTYFVRIGASSADQQGTGVFRFVTQGVCSQCPGDLNGDGVVSGVDLGLWLIEEWRECSPTGPCIGDLDQDGKVGGSDLGVLLAAWGDCP